MCSASNNLEEKEETSLYFVWNISFAAQQRIILAKKNFDWCHEVNKPTYHNALKNLQQYIVNAIKKSTLNF